MSLIDYCYFCNGIMLRSHYFDMEHPNMISTACNNMGCMGYSYCFKDDKLNFKELALNDNSFLFFKADLESNILYVFEQGKPVKQINNALEVELDIILDKDKTLNLLSKLRKLAANLL